MNSTSYMVMSSILNSINQLNTNNKTADNRNINLNSNSFDTLLKNSLAKYSTSCNCSNTDNELNLLTTVVGLLNSIKVANTYTDNSTGTTVDNLTSINNSTINEETKTSSKINQALGLAEKQIGKPYIWGANGPSSFDCSGLTRYIYKEALGKDIPRTSYDQSTFGQKVDKENLQRGDLVFFDTMNKGRVSHVGIYVGDGEFIHASNPRDGVKKSSLSSSYYEKTYRGARRP